MRLARGVVVLFGTLTLVLLTAWPATSTPHLRAAATPVSLTAGSTTPQPAAVNDRPFYAYFYQWFNSTSWTRAKQDYPLAGLYSSDDPHVLRNQVEQAKGAGLDGFLTSWKHTDNLDRRLDLLVRIARDERFDVGIVYEALDFRRQPLPVAQVRSDLVYLLSRWQQQLTSRFYGRPVIIWTGTDQYSLADVQSVRSALGSRAYLLAASKQVAGYERVAGLVDGEAYYWSSADPSAASTAKKLIAMGAAVHAHKGLWIAPAAPGFDGRTLGHSRVIARRGGQTLLRSLHDAEASDPDAVGLISWNEWSENTYIEPSRRYRNQDLNTLRNYLAGRPAPARVRVDTPSDQAMTWTGLQAAVALGVVTIVGALLLVLRARRRPRAGPPAQARHLAPW